MWEISLGRPSPHSCQSLGDTASVLEARPHHPWVVTLLFYSVLVSTWTSRARLTGLSFVTPLAQSPERLTTVLEGLVLGQSVLFTFVNTSIRWLIPKSPHPSLILSLLVDNSEPSDGIPLWDDRESWGCPASLLLVEDIHPCSGAPGAHL